MLDDELQTISCKPAYLQKGNNLYRMASRIAKPCICNCSGPCGMAQNDYPHHKGGKMLPTLASSDIDFFYPVDRYLFIALFLFSWIPISCSFFLLFWPSEEVLGVGLIMHGTKSLSYQKERKKKGTASGLFPSLWLPWAFSPFSHLLQPIYSVTSQTDNVQANDGQNITNKNTMT